MQSLTKVICSGEWVIAFAVTLWLEGTLPLSTTHHCLTCRLEEAAEDIHRAWTDECCNLTDGKERIIIRGLHNDYRAVVTAALLPISGLQVTRGSVTTQDLDVLNRSSGQVLQACRLA